MRARSHGEQLSPQAHDLHKLAVDGSRGLPCRFILDPLVDCPAYRLESSPGTVAALVALGEGMARDLPPEPRDTAIPAAFTYFGQFIDHDVTTSAPAFVGQQDPITLANFEPLKREHAERVVTNTRAVPLQLECLYGHPAVLGQGGRMQLGEVSSVAREQGPISTADRFHDVPRRPWICNPRNADENALDREALIGDVRNDENVIISQMHVAFLRAHNALVERHQDADEARKQLRRRYQWAVLHDFLNRVCDRSVVSDVHANGPRFVNMGGARGPFMPLEFSGAAYRYGHSMIRDLYKYNATIGDEFLSGRLTFMFTFTALSGNIGLPGRKGFGTLPDNWIIEWPRFFERWGTPGLNPARRIDTRLALPLASLTDTLGQPMAAPMGKVAIRNLLRGYWLGLPTGQAVAKFMGVEPLDETVLIDAAPEEVRSIFEQNAFHKRTPLWFYILAEAGNRAGPDGQHLGQIGSRIVAETLWSFVKHSRGSSVLAMPPTQHELESGEFTLRGIIKLGQDRGMQPL